MSSWSDGRGQPAPPFFLFDGDCGFCARWARWLQRRLPSSTTFLPYQQIDGLEAYGVTVEDVRSASYWIDHDGVAHGGASSFAEGLRHARRPWSAVGAILRVPLIAAIADRAYPIVVRNRHRLPAPGDR